MHEPFSFFEVVKTLLALFESGAAFTFSQSLRVALGSWSGGRECGGETQNEARQRQLFHMKPLSLAKPGGRPAAPAPSPGRQLDAHCLYPGVIRVSAQYRSHVCSKLLISANSRESAWLSHHAWARLEPAGWGRRGITGGLHLRPIDGGHLRSPHRLRQSTDVERLAQNLAFRPIGFEWVFQGSTKCGDGPLWKNAFEPLRFG